MRAGVAATLEASQYTSAYERIVADQRARGVEVQSAKRSSRTSRASRRAAQSANRQRLGLSDV